MKMISNLLLCAFALLLILSPTPDALHADSVDTGLGSGEGVSVETPLIIGLGSRQVNGDDMSDLQQAYRHIFLTITPNASETLLYPESFAYTSDASVETPFEDGALFRLSGEDPAWETFQFIRAGGPAIIGRAKALHEGHIAILDIDRQVAGENRHLTWEADAYCGILHTYIGKHERCFRGYDDYLAYLEDDDFPLKETTSIIYMHPVDIQSGFLREDGRPFFSLLILPDFITGLGSAMIDALGNGGLAEIRAFVQAGGTVLASGKSAWLLEWAGLLATGSVDPAVLVRNRANRGEVVLSNGTDFNRRLAGLGLLPDGDGAVYSYFLSSFLVDGSLDPLLFETAHFDLSGADFYFQDPVTLQEIPKGAGPMPDRMPAMAVKHFGDGKILLLTGHPASSDERCFPFVFNAVFDAFARVVAARLEVIQTVSEEVPPNVIPALESDVQLLGALDIQNHFDQPVALVEAVIHVAEGFQADVDGLGACQSVTPVDPGFVQKIVCQYAEIGAFANQRIEFPMSIVDPAAAQQQNDILAAVASASYVSPEGRYETAGAGGGYLNAEAGAEIRAEYNPDPSSFYPLKGEGVFIDNVLDAQNKENTNALEVEHIAMVPLISPVVDGDDQGSLVYTLEFFDAYYKSHPLLDANAFVFPFVNAEDGNRDYDYIDYQTLQCTDSVLSADWDTPVKVEILNRSETALPAPPDCPDRSFEEIIGKDYAYTIPTEDLTARQLYFADADDYYEHATQRQLVYLDTTREAGALTYYDGAIPPELENDGAARKQLIFARNDIYFYDNPNYPLPEGVTDPDVFFTLDRYNQDPGGALQCGNPDGVVAAGYFDDDPALEGILANEYDNQLKCRHNKTPIDVTRLGDEAYASLIDPDRIRLSHYLFPVDAVDEIDSASDLVGFDPATGLHQVYPELKFITAHTVDFELQQADTPRGGRLVLTLPSGVDFTGDPLAGDRISLSADHIAIRGVQYDSETQIITVDFVRGSLPDQTRGKADAIRLNLEDLDAPGGIAIGAQLQSLHYNLGDPDNMARYEPVPGFPATLNLEPAPFFSLPCLRLRFRLHRGESQDQSYLQQYERLSPLARYGVYIQELAAHRTVYAYTENHPVEDPGLVVRNGGFSTFSNIGVSTIPFREYLQTGARQIIPSASETSRVDYQDVWHRQWSTPLRTVVPDVPPIPPPLRNFMINTTFEMRDLETGQRMLAWNSDREAEVLYKIKLLNNYPKYFEPTVSKANEYLLRAAGPDEAPNLAEKQFVDPDPAHLGAAETDDDLYLVRANSAQYGVGYQTEGDMAGGQTLSDQDRIDILAAEICADEDTCPDMTGVPTIGRRPPGETGPWNYSQAAADYFPVGYISEAMWSLTHYDYADDAFAKGYPYHMDNLLPNLDNVRGGILRPHNIIAQPVPRGLGFNLQYDGNYISSHFMVDGAPLTGWRSDNLQNRDDTLLGGQSAANAISVGQADLMTDRWVEIDEMQTVAPHDQNALNNIYACLFNRWRARIDPQNDRIVHAANVYRNNVIPIPPELDKNDPDLTAYDCGGSSYTPDAIHEVDNVVRTDDKDWLYFGAALRGGAKETINVVSRLSPIEGAGFEGAAKINDGARFVYWNPANGPNSFLVLDDGINVVEALRNDLQMLKEVIPVEAPTFNADIYHLITLMDLGENQRQFTESPYLNHFGFGDAAAAVTVGTAKNLDARGSILEPGRETTVRIDLINNSGYDWNLIKSAEGVMAIEAVELPPEAINANDLLYKTKHAIRLPTAFHFLSFDIPPALQGFVSIAPSTHNIHVAGMLFDFQQINVTRIRDGFRGSYYIDLTLSASLPDSSRGRTYDIGVSLNEAFFDAYPGHAQDPVAHDYTLQVPAIRLGVPYQAGHALAGRVYHTSGRASDLSLEDQYPFLVDPRVMKRVSSEEIQDFRVAAADPETRQDELRTLFEDGGFGETFGFTAARDAEGNTTLTARFDANSIDAFPIAAESPPDQAELYLMVHSFAAQLPYGENIVNQNTRTDYMDFSGFEKTAEISDPPYRTVRASGPDIQASYTHEVIDPDSDEIRPGGFLSPTEPNRIEVAVRLENVGSDIAYLPRASIFLPGSVTFIGTLDPMQIQIVHHADGAELRIELAQDMAPGEANLIRVLLEYSFTRSLTLLDLLTPPAYAQEGDLAAIIDHVDVRFDLTDAPGENRVTQRTAGLELLVARLDIFDVPNGSGWTITLTTNIPDAWFRLIVETRSGNGGVSQTEFGLNQGGVFDVNLPDAISAYGVAYTLETLPPNRFGEVETRHVDVIHSASISMRAPGDVANVPVFGPWGLIAFMLAMGLGGVVKLRRKRF